jgi:hypothetical protein
MESVNITYDCRRLSRMTLYTRANRYPWRSPLFFLSLKICHFNRYFSLKRHLSFLFCTLYEKMKSTDACTLEAFFPSSYMFIEENCSCTSIYKERNQLYVYTYIYIYKIGKSKSENDENVLCHQWSIHWPWVEVQIQ